MLLPMVENTYLIPDEKYQAGLLEFRASFLHMPGVNGDLLTEKWIENCYRMVIYKLSRYAIRSRLASALFLTPENILEQMKYRYDREIDRTERSCLRRFTEGDDNPCKRIVLEVVRVVKHLDQPPEMELSDGWYTIQAMLDEELVEQINKNNLVVGKKIITSGAELRNHHQQCHPLEVCSYFYY